MATWLFKLGAFSARRAWIVLTAWILLLLGAVTFAATSGGSLSTTMSVPGTPAQVLIDDLQKSFPSASRGSGQVVIHTSNGSAFTAAQQKAISDLLVTVDNVPSVDSVVNPFSTTAERAKFETQITQGLAQIATAKATLAAQQKQLDAGRAALDQAAAGMPAAQAELALAAQRAQLTAGQQQLDDAKATLTSKESELLAGQQLLTAASQMRLVSADGSAALATVFFDTPGSQVTSAQKNAVVAAFEKSPIDGVTVEYTSNLTQNLDGLMGPGELVGLAIAAIVLFIMLGTLVAAGLPVLAAIIGVGISVGTTFGLSKWVDMTSTTPMLGLMLGLAVGIDYALFILNRHRNQLKAGMKVRASIALANGTSGSAVLFAGVTVIIALIALNLTGIAFLGLMGTVGAASIVVAVLVALTFTPALLSLLDMRVLSKKERAAVPAEDHHTEDHVSVKPVFANRHPWVTAIASIIALGIIALPVSTMRLGLPDGSAEPIDSTQYRAYSITSDKFGEGVNGQISTIVKLDQPLTGSALTSAEAAMATRLMKVDNVVAVAAAGVSSDNKTILFQVVPKEGPSALSTEKLVFELRALSPEFVNTWHGTLGATGFTAVQIDISKTLSDALPLYLTTVLILALIVLLMVFRSILVPIVAAGGFLLTIFATLGAVTAVYQWGWLGDIFGVHDPAPILSFLPTILIGILFGLAMDYQLFLVTGMREGFVHGQSANDSINHGIHLSRRVVVAAAIIMISVFGSFGFSHLTMIRPMGFGLGLGVLFDAFIVRLLIVPAVMTILGKSAWWMPRWLDRILPDVDVEGAKLERSGGAATRPVN